MDAAAVLKKARTAAGLTQAHLADLTATSQSAIAAYETGAREPTLPVLRRALRAAGHRLVVEAVPDPSLYRLVDAAADIRATPDQATRIRLVLELLRSAGEDGQPVRLIVQAEPEPTGELDRHDLSAAYLT